MDFFKRLSRRKKQPASKSTHNESEPLRLDTEESASLGFPNGLAPAELGYYREVLRIAQYHRDFPEEWQALENIGDVFVRSGDNQRAAAYYEQALNLARGNNDQRRETGSLFSLSEALEKVGETGKAKHYRDEALAIARESEGTILSDLGIHLASAVGEEYLKRAADLFELHLQIAREAGSRASEEAALGNLGSAYLSLGFVHRAIDYFKKALIIAKELDDTDGMEGALGSLASAYKNVGDLQKATEYFDEALALSRETGNQNRLAINALNKARLLVQQGDLKRALPLAREAAEIFGRRGDPNAQRAKELVAEILSS
jgi:tetratricopeptide (TPR) repeat protein